ncbi:23S rRNA (uridine(2552)-2'-O)-methyltransferase [Halococcus saccharolyticus]|uniref:Ribosomal RNA large subunit methyltransferase E n=1 Tax=Halococcus saccharolyticus DSM 5350 TaxID=1227455 RepID=M0MGA2_9EURY|nr:23S rRNA (uridine(2552)-2'-O)-methyltransferase [Halococcus saccharolyticus]EMA43724.1 23S rRNA methyltransferase J [Halococcus saccharolyticus DSM 5350]
MSGRDEYYNKAKQQGYRSRSAYKLQQLDDTADLIASGDTVIDLGAAPGGWLQVAAERTDDGRVVGVDRQRIESIDGVETVRGDLTEDDTQAELAERVGEADLVLSDMAPNMTGEYDLDHARSVHLARQALDVARTVLAPGGDLVVKVFDGRDLDDLEADIEDEFEYVRTVRPEASRDESSELYLVGKGRMTAPVETGDELSVEITDTGDEGDGIAKVEEYTLFVSGAEEGETVRVRIEDVKPRFGFAERID